MKIHTTMHWLHFLVTLLFWPWLLVWMIRWSSNNKKNKLQEWKLQKEQTEALIKLANKE